MYSSKYFTVAAATFALVDPSVAIYDASSSENLALYWGSGPSQANLSYYCEQSSVDIIPLGFMDVFPAQGDGYPAENFGNACYGQPIFTPGPGYPLGNVDTSKDQLYVQCPGIQEGIPYCQSLGKKILISLGGASSSYQLTGAADGKYFADFLWGSYGPFKQSWLDAGGIRPMDGGYYGTDSSIHIDIDGFDFDIEIAPTDSSEGYIAMINRLRENFADNPSKKYLISGAPQCPLPEPNMGAMIAGAQFDLLWIQFYNNDWARCTARQWVDNYALTGQEDSAEFTYDQWVSTINSGASTGASIYLGLLGSPLAGIATDYISPIEAQSLIDSYHNKPQFGGVMVWEATYSQENKDSDLNGQSYHAFIKSCLSSYEPLPPTSTSSAVSSTTISSYSSKSEATITSSAPSSVESPAASSSALDLISSYSVSFSDYPAAPSLSFSESSAYSSESSSVPSLTSTEASITSSLTSASISESSAVQSSSSSESTISPPVFSTSIFLTAISSGHSIPGCAHNATSHLAHSSKSAGSSKSSVHSFNPTGSYTFAGHSSKSTSNPSHNSKSQLSSKPYPTSIISTGHSSEPYPTKSSMVGTGHSTKTYPTKSSVVDTGYPSRPYPTRSARTDVKSCKSKTKKTKTKTKTSSPGSSGYPGSSSLFTITSTAPCGNNTYSHSRTKPDLCSTSSTEGITVSSSSSSHPGSIATESNVVGSSTTGVNKTSSGSITSSGSLPLETGSVSASGFIPSGAGSITSVVQYTTSTAYVTTVYNVTSCAITLTDCPRRIGSVTTETISSYTTVYPVSAISTSSTRGVGISSKPSSAQEVTASQPSSSSVIIASSVSSSSAQGATALPITSAARYTTSTVYATTVYTITSCAASVTDCPARIGSVTTETISLHIIVCTVTETGENSGILSSKSSPAVAPTRTIAPVSYETSAVYWTSVYTITSCAPSVTDCPARSGQLTTETISSYTFLYPITVSSAPINIPSSEPSSAAGVQASIFLFGASSAAGVSSSLPTSEAESVSPTNLYTTKISTLINSQAITISAITAPSTTTVIPVPMTLTVAPPHGAGNGTLVASGSASSRVSKPSSYIGKAESESTKSAVPSPTALTFEGVAGRAVGMGMGMGMAVCVVLGFLVVI